MGSACRSCCKWMKWCHLEVVSLTCTNLQIFICLDHSLFVGPHHKPIIIATAIFRLESQVGKLQKNSFEHERLIEESRAKMCNGEFVWKIDKIHQRVWRVEPGDITRSVPFYTSTEARYKLCVGLLLKGNRTDTWMHSHLPLHTDYERGIWWRLAVALSEDRDDDDPQPGQDEKW